MNDQTENLPQGEDAEIMLPATVDQGMVGALARAEIDLQISTAKNYPRSLKHCIDNIMTLATYDEQTAAENIYALPRGGKPIKGPSIRLAEIVAQQWRNNRVDARVLMIDRINKVVVAEGSFHDLETNSATRAVVQRRISDKRGIIYNDDMIVTTGNAACSIAKRNAILGGVPKAIWRRAYEASEKVVAGDITTLSVRRENAIKAFAAFGVKPEQIFAMLEVAGVEEITLEHIPTLIGMHSALKSGEETVESMFDPRRIGTAGVNVVKNPLQDEPQKDDLKTEAQPSTQKPDPDSSTRTNSETAAASATAAAGAAGAGSATMPSGAASQTGSAASKQSEEDAEDAKARAAMAAFRRGQQAKRAGVKRNDPKFEGKGDTDEAKSWLDGYNSVD